MSAPIPQVAAVPLLDGRVCLVTSRSGRRWVVPKGGIGRGFTPVEAARQEAWEEAGLIGAVGESPVGHYLYAKNGRTHHVTVYRMDVSEAKPEWPERSARRRVWLDPSEALQLVDEPPLREMIARLGGLPTESSS